MKILVLNIEKYLNQKLWDKIMKACNQKTFDTKDLLVLQNKIEAETSSKTEKPKPFVNSGPKLSLAQIENRKYSIYIKNLKIESDEKISAETNQTKTLIQSSFE